MMAKRLSLAECVAIALERSATRKVTQAGVAIAEAQHRQALAAYWPQLTLGAFSQLRSNEPNFAFPGMTVNTPQMAVNTPAMQFRSQASTFTTPASVMSVPASTMTLPAGTLGPGTPPITIPVPAQQVNVPSQKIAVPSQSVNVPGQKFAVDSQQLHVDGQKFDLLDRHTSGINLEGKWLLFDGGERVSRKRQARSGVRAAEEEVRLASIQLVSDVKRYYEGAVLARRLTRLGEDVLARMEATLELTEKFYKGGSMKVTKMDYLRNKVVVDGMRSMVENLNANYALACSALTHAMGLGWESRIEPNRDVVNYQPVKGDLAALVQESYEFSPNWNKVLAGIEAAEHGVKKAKAGFMPKVALTGNIHAVDNGLDGGLATDENLNAWTVGVGVELPIFRGFLNKNRLAEARARLARMSHKQVLLREGLGMQVKAAFISLGAAQKREKDLGSAVATAKENRNLTERAYRAGMTEADKIFEALMIESFMQAQRQRVRYEAVESRIGLDSVVGRGFAEFLSGAFQTSNEVAVAH